jgi:SAM-dependent methyltransferase
MSEDSIAEQINKIFGYLRGFHATYYLDIGMRLGLFQALSESPRHPEEIASALGLHLSYVRSFCETGYHLDILERDGDLYHLAPHMNRLLASPDDTFFLGGFPRVHLTVAQDYSLYPELFKSGGVFSYQAHNSRFLEDVAGATKTLPRMFLEIVGPKLPDVIKRLEDGGRFLDVGCGAGHALVTFAERFPRSSGVGIEIEPVSAEMARAEVQLHKLDNRIQIYKDWNITGGYEERFDLVTQFLVLHEIQPELKQGVLEQCAAALKLGGVLLLFDECYPDDEKFRDPIRGFSVVSQWTELTWGNIINTRAEIHALIARAGLTLGDETELSRFHILTAWKR